jgi:hypothetical protein
MSDHSGVPRTDALLAASPIGFGIGQLCRELEREAAALRADRDALAVALRRMINDCMGERAIFRPTIGSISNAQQALSQHGGGK